MAAKIKKEIGRDSFDQKIIEVQRVFFFFYFTVI